MSADVKRRSIPLMSFEGSVRPQESSRPLRRPDATSAPFATAPISFGRSDGWFCRSPSIVTTISPRALTRPACMAGCWPKLRLKRTALTRGSPVCRRSTVAHVPSLEPSSTTITSNVRESRSRTAIACSTTCSMVLSSLKTGTTRETSGRSSSVRSGSARGYSSVSAIAQQATISTISENLREDMNSRLAERVELIEQDDRHGASWLAREAVEAACEAVQMGEDPVALAQRIVRARPAMGAIAGALGRVLVSGRSDEQIIEEARAVIEARERASKAIAVLLSPHIQGTVMTHSNSATVREAVEHTPPERLICTVSEPGEEGRELVEALRGDELAVDLVDDSDAEHAVETVDLLLLGADTVFRDGSLVNKVGTSGLAKAAKKAGVPVIVACEVIKLAPEDPRHPGEDRFDLTAPKHIDLYVTEEGEFPPRDIAALIDRTPFLHDGYALLLAD